MVGDLGWNLKSQDTELLHRKLPEAVEAILAKGAAATEQAQQDKTPSPYLIQVLHGAKHISNLLLCFFVFHLAVSHDGFGVTI